MTQKVIFIDSVHPILSEELTGMSFECIDYTSKSREEILKDIHLFVGVVIRSKFTFDKEVFSAATNLKFIARSGAGLENIDLKSAKTHEVAVYNSPEGNRTAVGEQALGMLLSLFNNLNKADQEVRNGIWDREGNRGYELSGKTVGIIGCGHMGNAFAKRLLGFECNVLGYDKYKTTYGNKFITESSLETIYKEADIVSIHLPLNNETSWYINAGFIDRFEKPIYVINTSRGKQLNTVELLMAIEQGKVKGACLDVLEYEKTSFENLSKEDLPESFQYLIENKKVILAPHIAGWTHESYVKLSSFLAEKIKKDVKKFLK